MIPNKFIRYLFFVIPAIIFWGCSKPYSEALPTAKIVSVVPYGVADSVMITGTVTYTGGGPIQYEGFSFSNVPLFSITTRQLLLNTSSATFSAVVPAYHDSTFYFECFVANEYGYGISNVYTYTIPVSQPDSAPCTLASNSLILNGQANSFDFAKSNTNPPYGYGTYMVSADFAGGFYYYDVYFNQVPVNGIYHVLSEADFYQSSDKYAVALDFGGNYSFNEGGYVYIAQNKSGSITLSFCSLTVNVGFSGNNTVSSKVTFN